MIMKYISYVNDNNGINCLINDWNGNRNGSVLYLIHNTSRIQHAIVNGFGFIVKSI